MCVKTLQLWMQFRLWTTQMNKHTDNASLARGFVLHQPRCCFAKITCMSWPNATSGIQYLRGRCVAKEFVLHKPAYRRAKSTCQPWRESMSAAWRLQSFANDDMCRVRRLLCANGHATTTTTTCLLRRKNVDTTIALRGRLHTHVHTTI